MAADHPDILSKHNSNNTNTQIKVVDITSGHSLGPGSESTGEICLRGPQVMMGYFNNQAETDNTLAHVLKKLELIEAQMPEWNQGLGGHQDNYPRRPPWR